MVTLAKDTINYSGEFNIDNLPKEINATAIMRKIKKGGEPLDCERKLIARGKYNFLSDEKKIEVVTVYCLTGSYAETQRLTRVPQTTVRMWRKQDWWSEVTQRIRTEKNDELDAKFTKIIDKAVEQIEDRIEKGDYIYDVKRGKILRKEVGLKDLNAVTSIVLDKRQLLRGEPTSISGKISQKDRLDKLAEEFRKFSKAKTLTNEEVEVETITEPITGSTSILFEEDDTLVVLEEENSTERLKTA